MKDFMISYYEIEHSTQVFFLSGENMQIYYIDDNNTSRKD